METIKATCLYCGMVGEMKVIDKYFIDGRPGRLFEIECPRCHRPFGHHVENEKEVHHGGQSGSIGKAG